MEELSRLLLEERSHSEQFKANFMKLKIEYDKILADNHRLNDDILKLKEYKPEEPNEVVKRKLKNAEKQLQSKDCLILSLQEELRTINESLKEKLCYDKQYASRIASTENALEQTKVLLSNLQLETSVLVKNVEKTRKTDEQDHQRDLMMLADRCAQSDHDRRVIARQVLKATSKARKTTDLLKQENSLLSFTITKLKETLDKICWDKSELSSQLDTLKVQHGQDRGELIMQIRNLECEHTKLQAKCDATEKSMQEALREKEKAVLAFQAAENNEIKLRNSVFALEIKFEKTCDQFKGDMEYKDQINNIEVQELKKHIHALKVELDEERSKIQQQSENLRVHEKELIVAKEELRKKEIEVNTQVQDVKIATENKYRAIIEDKFQNEMETARKYAEIQSQLILERNLKTSLESELRRLMSNNQTLSERIRSLDELEMDQKRLKNTIEFLEKEKNELSEQLDRNKQSSAEQYETFLKELEISRSGQAIANETMLKTVSDLREQVTQLQCQLAVSEQNAESQVKRLETSLKINQQKSQQYAKLIWKLRQRLALTSHSKQIVQPTSCNDLEQ
ncbi:cingulin-like protein 1 [Daphnia carinata]|uniref:cingulin-like protein 1 n=1 Tax=Daphnia carinata TaxID=120202 RepID=UPI00257C5E79|nr:cingulin-like protein 1 [Daphnia carinata]